MKEIDLQPFLKNIYAFWGPLFIKSQQDFNLFFSLVHFQGFGLMLVLILQLKMQTLDFTCCCCSFRTDNVVQMDVGEPNQHLQSLFTSDCAVGMCVKKTWTNRMSHVRKSLSYTLEQKVAFSQVKMSDFLIETQDLDKYN